MDEDINVEEDLQINDENELTESMENGPTEENSVKESPNQKQRLIRLPLSRIKTIMKLDPDCALVSQDSAFLITKATVSIALFSCFDCLLNFFILGDVY